MLFTRVPTALPTLFSHLVTGPFGESDGIVPVSSPPKGVPARTTPPITSAPIATPKPSHLFIADPSQLVALVAFGGGPEAPNWQPVVREACLMAAAGSVDLHDPVRRTVRRWTPSGRGRDAPSGEIRPMAGRCCPCPERLERGRSTTG